MSVDDQSDVWRELREMKRKIARLESGSMLENSSITRGRMRFIGGTLRVDSGGRVEIVGTLDITGDTTITGSLDVDGPWSLDGNGDITGDVALTGDLTVDGAGRVVVGNVTIDPQNGGRVVVDDGGRVVVRATETGQPDLRLIQGRVRFGDAFIEGAQSGSTINMAGPPGADSVPARVTVNDQWAEIVGGLGGKVRADDNGVMMDGVDLLPTGEPFEMIVRSTNDGRLYRYAGGTGGGPGDGIFAWPFPLDQVTSEFRSPERPTHDGIDFGIGPSNIEGTPIPSAGSGVVETVGAPGGSHGWGHYVLVNHGQDPLYGNATIQTRYAHMHQAPPVQVSDPVTLGMTLGGIGNTGNSFGNHLHYEVIADGVPINPRTFHAAHGG